MFHKFEFQNRIIAIALVSLFCILGCNQTTTNESIGPFENQAIVASPGSSVAPGSIFSPRVHHTATLLRNGKVLLVGGESNDGAINSLEIYDVETGTWIKGSSLPRPTFEQISNLIGEDLLMIAGGHDGQNPLASTLIYDSKVDAWTSSLDMSVPRTKHVSTVLSDDRIFVHGGLNLSLIHI